MNQLIRRMATMFYAVAIRLFRAMGDPDEAWKDCGRYWYDLAHMRGATTSANPVGSSILLSLVYWRIPV